MNEKDMTLMAALQQAGVTPAAYEDALRRAEVEFAQDTTLSPYALTEWVAGLRASCPHYFAATSSATPGIPTTRSKRPQPVRLTAEQERALANLPPTERLSKYRELQRRERGR